MPRTRATVHSKLQERPRITRTRAHAAAAAAPRRHATWTRSPSPAWMRSLAGASAWRRATRAQHRHVAPGVAVTVAALHAALVSPQRASDYTADCVCSCRSRPAHLCTAQCGQHSSTRGAAVDRSDACDQPTPKARVSGKGGGACALCVLAATKACERRKLARDEGWACARPNNVEAVKTECAWLCTLHTGSRAR